jgi:LacI family transcriptional regulator
MMERKVDGVAIMTFGIQDLLLDRFAAERIPVVVMDVASSHARTAVLSVDYRAGILKGVAHLAALGHTRIGFISGPLRLRSATTRKQAFLRSLRDLGLQPKSSWMVEGDHTLDGGRDAMQTLLAQRQWPTAVMCSNDMTAIGVQHALFEADLKVPDDFSLIGFDDIHLAEYTIPPLTTVRMACTDLAQNAVRCLLSHVEPDDTGLQTRATISTRLIVRQTTGPPRAAAVGASRH